jgi:hypothetical protein
MIQEVEKKEAVGTVGMSRTINKAAEGMVMDIVQAQQYTKPVPSTVRELTANAVDSQSEKERALDILSGKAKVEDYFIKREGALYSDSAWDPTYYDTKWLNKSKTNIELNYIQGEGSGRCDTFEVVDHGVGIGLGRLEGILQIGYSTKRNRKDALGAFGLGAKVGLSTGADFYTIETAYNGVLYVLKVFNRKVSSMIGSLNLNTGLPNKAYTFSDGYVIYGEETTSLNYTKISVPALKHHKNDYITAVKTQLLYFNNVDFNVRGVDGSYTIDFRADVLYNSENLIISKRTSYSKPHVVIIKGGDDIDKQTGVCYGHIDFEELELEDMRGDIGIKCPIRQVIEDEDGNEVVINEGVEVVPSRETVRWTPKTREFIKSRFQAAQEEASKLIEKELKHDSLHDWLKACVNINSYSNGDSNILSRISRIVDLKEAKPTHKRTGAKFHPIVEFFFNGYTLTKCEKVLDRSTKKYIVKEDKASWSDVVNYALYHKPESVRSNRYTDCYIYDVLCSGSPFIKVSYDETAKSHKLPLLFLNKTPAENRTFLKDNLSFDKYDLVNAPDTYRVSLDKVESDIEEDVVEPTPAELRKLQARMVYKTFSTRFLARNDTGEETYKRVKVEPRVVDIQSSTVPTFYGFQADEPMLQYACHILDQPLSRFASHERFDNSVIRIASVAMNAKKHFKRHRPIADFFGYLEGEEYIMNEHVVKWNTARKIGDLMLEMEFMRGFENINEDAHADWKTLMKYYKDNHTNLDNYMNRSGVREFHKNFVDFLDKSEKLQVLNEANASSQEIGDLVKELTLPASKTLVVDREMMNILESLNNYAANLQLLNSVEFLYRTPTLEQSMMIEEYVELKKVKYERIKEE